ncbi:hypothetical protein [Fusobacterium varium]|uniref:hypothetical protein n=1 Tax=Fusobacterium varium TaxID=856 RepID=UPI003565B11B
MEKLLASSNIKPASSIIITFKVSDFLFYEKNAKVLKNYFNIFSSKSINIFSEIIFYYIYLQLKFANKTNKKSKILNIIFKDSDIEFYNKNFNNKLFEYFLKAHLTKMENQLLKFLLLDIDTARIYKETGMDIIFINKRIEGIRRKIEKFIEIKNYDLKNYIL